MNTLNTAVQDHLRAGINLRNTLRKAIFTPTSGLIDSLAEICNNNCMCISNPRITSPSSIIFEMDESMTIDLLQETFNIIIGSFLNNAVNLISLANTTEIITMDELELILRATKDRYMLPMAYSLEIFENKYISLTI